MKLCSAPNCTYGVWGKGYCKIHQYLREDFDKRTIQQRGLAKAQKALRELKNLPDNKEAVKNELTRSQLMNQADRLFAAFIVNRDKDNKGNITCICCKNVFNVTDTDNLFYDKDAPPDKINNPKGNKIVQNMHFIDRNVYSLRFDEFNCHAGCSSCNFDMFHTKKGRAFKQYREYMVNQYGEEYVAEMEVAHRKVNRIDSQQLKVVIELYSQTI